MVVRTFPRFILIALLPTIWSRTGAFVLEGASRPATLRLKRQLASTFTDTNNVVKVTPPDPSDDKDDADSEATLYGWTDDQFHAWFAKELSHHPLMNKYPRILETAPMAVTAWRARYRGNPTLWRRVFTVDRVIKELVEAAPMLDAVIQIVDETNTDETGNLTVLDLASGRGFLSMYLSEILPKDKVEKIILVDKAWPMCNAKEVLPHQMSWEHIYGNRNISEDGEGAPSSPLSTYFDTWPIHLHTSEQDLKQKCTKRQMKKFIFDRAPGPVLILAVHLCGVLSLRAVEMFNGYPDKVQFLALKPCCLPPMAYANRDEVFEIGQHSFDASDVCAVGRFRGKRWYGPPRWHLEGRFEKWSEHLFAGVDLGESEYDHEIMSDDVTSQRLYKDGNGNRAKIRETVQLDGGYQNTYIMAERLPSTSKVWDGLGQLERPIYKSYL